MTKMAEEVKVEEVVAKTMTREQWAMYHAYRKIRHAERKRDEPLWPDEDVEAMMIRDSPFSTPIMFGAVLDGEYVSMFGSGLMKPDAPGYESNKHLLGCSFSVREPFRRQGLGTLWLAKAHELMEAHDKAVLSMGTDEEAGHAFLKWCGAEEKLVGAENRLQMADVDWDMIRSWVTAGCERSPESELVLYEPRIPADELEAYCEVFTRLLNTMPFDDLDHGEIVVTPAQQEEGYERMAQLGGIHHVMVVREPDGSISGMTDVEWFPQQKHIVSQGFTGVDPSQRGRGLGKWLKAAMLEHVRETYPDTEYIVTGNANSNDPMLSINKRMGFKEHRGGSSYQISRDALAGFLSSRPSQ